MVGALSSLHDPDSMAKMQQSLIKRVNEWLVYVYTHIHTHTHIHTERGWYMIYIHIILCIYNTIYTEKHSQKYIPFILVNVLGHWLFWIYTRKSEIESSDALLPATGKVEQVRTGPGSLNISSISPSLHLMTGRAGGPRTRGGGARIGHTHTHTYTQTHTHTHKLTRTQTYTQRSWGQSGRHQRR